LPLWIDCARIERLFGDSGEDRVGENLSLDLSPAYQQDCES
jgi:hypothetical protein